MNLFESTVERYGKGKMSPQQVGALGLFILALLISSVSYFGFGKVDSVSGFDNRVAMVVGIVGLAGTGFAILIARRQKFKLTTNRGENGLRIEVNGNAVRESVQWPFTWFRMACLPISSQGPSCRVEILTITDIRGKTIAFTKSHRDQKFVVGDSVLPITLDHHNNVFEIADLDALRKVLEDEAWDGYLPGMQSPFIGLGKR